MAKAISIDRLLKKHQLEPHAKLVKENLEPSIRIDVGSETSRALKLGASKLGGQPDLANHTDWPYRADRPLQFLAQIDLAAVAAASNQKLPLPKNGHLLFWYDALQDWMMHNTKLPANDSVDSREYPFGVATHIQAGASLTRTPHPTFAEPHLPKKMKLRHYAPPKFGPCSEHRITFRQVTSINKDALTDLFDRAEALEEDGWRRVSELVTELHQRKNPRCEHRLLGSLYEVMGEDMRVHAQKFYAGRPGVRANSELTSRQQKSWIMLAQFGSDTSIKANEHGYEWMWGDMGAICFWIRRPDLEKASFAKAVAVIGGSG